MKLFNPIAFLLLLGFLSSCDFYSDLTSISDEAQITKQLGKLGVYPKSVAIQGDEVSVDGDMIYSKEYLLSFGSSSTKFSIKDRLQNIMPLNQFNANQEGQNNFKIEQYYEKEDVVRGVVGWWRTSKIRVYIKDDETWLYWGAATLKAMEVWSNAGSNVGFQIVTPIYVNGKPVPLAPSQYDIIIYPEDLPANKTADAQMPKNWYVGSQIRVNRLYHKNSLEEKTRTMAHEFGHTLGFHHTDWKLGLSPEQIASYSHILAFPFLSPKDPIESVMRSIKIPYSKVLHPTDAKAMRLLYPKQGSIIHAPILKLNSASLPPRSLIYTLNFSVSPVDELSMGAQISEIFQATTKTETVLAQQAFNDSSNWGVKPFSAGCSSKVTCYYKVTAYGGSHSRSGYPNPPSRFYKFYKGTLSEILQPSWWIWN